MSLNDVLAYIDHSIEDMTSDLFPLLRQPSISADGTGVQECADLLATIMRRDGITTDVVPTAGHPVVLGHATTRPEAPTLLVYGHYDVQPVDPVDAWTSPPFQPTIRDGRIYCRGSADNKGQLFAQLMAHRAWRAVAGSAPINLIYLFDGEEESGSTHLPDFIRHHRGALAADAAYVSDGPVDETGRYRVALGVRGLLALELVAHGAARDYHSGHFGNLLPNPAWELVDLLATMRDPDGRITIDGFHDDVEPPDTATADAARELPVSPGDFQTRHGVDRLAPMPEPGFFERLMFHPTLNISGLQSGYAGAGSKTIIPATAAVRLDLRLVVRQDPDVIYRRVCEHVARHAPHVEVRRIGGAVPPSRTPLDSPVVGIVEKAVEKVTGAAPLVFPSTGGTLPDHVFTRILGVPLVKVPYANADEANHAPDENLDLAYFRMGIRIAAAVIDAMARLPKKEV
ncbi:M20/M25/M40 family metallo-hydrolase [Fodinicola acaciae]|uniref:M20/M25/M40 family metallo-hydrolase n=1 Tax=Fodinicola acaciae TaxID=2681555 RepID=UPI0013D06A38|nr:M20/M25/M40 family metallo-hydrolase [Fodinicola acaciae]